MNITDIDDNTYNIAAFVTADDIAVGDMVYGDGKLHPVTRKIEIGPRRTIGSQILFYFSTGRSLWVDNDAIVATI